jgi:hypothetical protein
MSLHLSVEATTLPAMAEDWHQDLNITTTSPQSAHHHIGPEQILPRPYHPDHSYVAVNPFLSSVAQTFGPLAYDVEQNMRNPHSWPPTPMLLHPQQSVQPYMAFPTTTQFIIAFLFDTLPRQIYLHLQLRLPALYFSRVARIIEYAELSMLDIERMAVATTDQLKDNSVSFVNANWEFEPSIVSPPFSNLKSSWEGFVDLLMREWKTLNIVSVLLLSCVIYISIA